MFALILKRDPYRIPKGQPHAGEFAKGSLFVFDIDETLRKTNALIHVKDKAGATVAKLTNQEFNDHKLEDGHAYDFHEFRDAEKFHNESEPIVPMLNKLKAIHQNIKATPDSKSKVVMITARADFDDKEKFLDTFRKDGLDMDNIHVHRAGNIAGDELPATKKLKYIREYLNTHPYAEVHMFDDSKTNLAALLTLQKEYPHVKFNPIHVRHDGSTKKL